MTTRILQSHLTMRISLSEAPQEASRTLSLEHLFQSQSLHDHRGKTMHSKNSQMLAAWSTWLTGIKTTFPSLLYCCGHVTKVGPKECKLTRKEITAAQRS
ncbi:uncharacterized protein AAG666_018392 isoform 2-T2 [Megaptera novaeangliae]